MKRNAVTTILFFDPDDTSSLTVSRSAPYIVNSLSKGYYLDTSLSTRRRSSAKLETRLEEIGHEAQGSGFDSRPGRYLFIIFLTPFRTPSFDPLLQYAAYYNFTVFPGNTYDYDPYNSTIKDQVYAAMFGPGNCSDQITACKATGNNTICSDADSFCATNVEAVYDNVLNRDEYDVRELIDPSTGADPFPPTFYVEYLNTATVQAAIGAYVNFSESNPTVNDAFVTTGDDGREDNTVEDMRALIEQNITVVMYTGDADYNCNWLGGEAVSIEIDAPGFSSAGYTNITTSDGVIHGQVKQAGKFSFVRIYESGHEVPFYQPVVALELFERGINGLDLATGTQEVTMDSGYMTIGTPTSTYREGNSTIQFQVVNATDTYNTTTNAPNPIPPSRRGLALRS